MKKKILLSFIVIVLFFSMSLVVQDLPKAYRNIRFGESEETVKGKLLDDEKIKNTVGGIINTVEIGNYEEKQQICS